MDPDKKSEDAARCAHIRTLAQLATALQDPLAPLVIDLGGRFFSVDTVAARPRQPGSRSTKPFDDPCMDGDDSPRAHSFDSDSRFAVGAVGAGPCTADVSSHATSTASVHLADTLASGPSTGPRRPLRRRSARQAAGRPPSATPQQRAAQADIEMLPNDAEAAATDAADAQAARILAADVLADGLQRLGSDAGFSVDTGDDDMSLRMHDAAESDDGDVVAAGAQEGHRVAHNMFAAAAVSAATAGAVRDPKKPLCPPHFLDVVRSGTVLCNGAIELPQNMAIRITASCTLRDLRLRGPGIHSDEHWGYAYPGLVSVVGGGTGEIAAAARPRVVRANLVGLEILRVGNSNGIKVSGAADVTLTRCSVCNCRRNGIIVQGPSARAALRHCKSFQNEASGLWIVAQGHVTAAHCYFGDNCCNGAACWDAASTFSALRCVFQNNAANGVRFLYGAAGALDTCMIAGNQQQGLEAGEAATNVHVNSTTITGNHNWAVKTYERAAVFLRASSVNRGHEGALSVHASGGQTAVRASHCDFGGSFHVQNNATFSRLPQVAEAV